MSVHIFLSNMLNVPKWNTAAQVHTHTHTHTHIYTDTEKNLSKGRLIGSSGGRLTMKLFIFNQYPSNTSSESSPYLAIMESYKVKF